MRNVLVPFVLSLAITALRQRRSHKTATASTGSPPTPGARRARGFFIVLAITALAPVTAGTYELVDLRGDYRPGAAAYPYANWSADGEWLLFSVCEAGACHVASASRNPHPVRELAGPFGDETSGPTFRHEIADSGRRALYIATNSDPDAPRELWSRPIDGSALPVRLHQPLPDNYRVVQRVLSPDGRYVAFFVDVEGESEALGLAAVDGSFIDFAVDTGDELDDALFAFSPASDRVVYWLDTDHDGDRELWTVTVPGGEPEPLADLEIPDGTPISDPVFSLAGDRVVFSAMYMGHDVLLSVDIATNSSPYLLPPTNLGQQIRQIAVAAGGWVLFRSDFDTLGQYELWTVPDDGSLPPERIHEGLVAGGEVGSFVVAGSRVVYRAEAITIDQSELWSAAVTGLGSPSRRSAPLAADRDVLDFLVSDDGTWVVYRADGEENGRQDLYRNFVAGPLSVVEQLSNVNPFQTTFYDVADYDVAPDSQRVAFEAIDTTAGAQIFEQPLADPTDFPDELADLHELDSFHYLGDSMGLALDGRPTFLHDSGWYLVDRRIFGDGFELGHAGIWGP